jgi:hypothetical protein
MLGLKANVYVLGFPIYWRVDVFGAAIIGGHEEKSLG